ncbi:hypothetical protein NEK97_11815 [Paenarthrobacter sp. UW852]|uniref:hypothetical protein n=1 Tax=Paenarthrobacter sp. UW852 TaxID=2951989 RepID=UPI0021480017|nr:hypothetical protein [Paenarthrobacter sp. UW852]MCR1162150.1 hypothetical protein [Paenarthrobacter sp. UW852]
MSFLLVLQWPARSEVDYDELIAMEDLLLEQLPEAHGVVDGHDFGSGEMNIFVYTERPMEAFEDVMTLLSSRSRWSDARAAYRPIDAEEFVILWP